MRITILGLTLLLLAAASPACGERLWTDATGQYTTDASLVDYDGANVVLKKSTGEIVSLPLEKLSRLDQDFLKNQASFMADPQPSNGNRGWTLHDGTKIAGQVLSYGQNHVVIQRQLGRILVNGTPFKELSNLQQQAVRRTIEYFDHVVIKDYATLERWATQQKTAPRDFLCNGVLFESPNGEKDALPFFLLREDEEYLKPGWEQWLAQEKAAQERAQYQEANRRQASYLARNEMRDSQRNEFLNQLTWLGTIQAGIFSEWEVQLYPNYGNPGPPLHIFVPARTSLGAQYVAAMNYPGYSVGPVAKISGRWW